MSITRRQRDILTHCTNAPKTVYELAEHFETHPQTLRRELWELQRNGLITEATFRKGKAKRWVSIVKTQEDAGTANLIALKESVPPVGFIEGMDRYVSSIGAIGFLPRFILSKMLQEHGYEKGWALAHEKFGSVGFPSVAQTRNLLHVAIPIVKEFCELLEAIDNMMAWEDPDYTVMIYGKRDVQHDEALWERIRENLQEFNRVINERGWDTILEPMLRQETT